MPKLLVLVEKDETGKLWNYIFNQKDETTNITHLAAPHWLIHKPEPYGTIPQHAQIEHRETEHIEISMMPPEEKITSSNSLSRRTKKVKG